MLLQKACENVLVDDRMFQVILLLIGASVDVNIVDENGRCPRHWLVNEEMSLFPWNELRNWNLDHGSMFTEAIIALVIAGCHQDKTDNNGETAWNKCILLEDVMVYPVPKFISLMEEYRQVRPLSCLCASIIKKNGIPFNNLKTSLVSFVRAH